MKNVRTKFTLAAVMVALLGSACASDRPTTYKGALELPKNEVEVTNFSHSVNFADGSATLSDAEKAGLDNFVYSQGLGYGDQLVLDFASGDTAWGEKMAAVNNFLKTRGFWVKYATQSGSNSDVNSAALVVNRYSVITPDCVALGEESFVPGELWNNKTFGCVNAHNLGLMVANPQDLIEGQPDTLPATWSAVRAMQMYRSRHSLSFYVVGPGGVAAFQVQAQEYVEEAK